MNGSAGPEAYFREPTTVPAAVAGGTLTVTAVIALDGDAEPELGTTSTLVIRVVLPSIMQCQSAAVVRPCSRTAKVSESGDGAMVDEVWLKMSVGST